MTSEVELDKSEDFLMLKALALRSGLDSQIIESFFIELDKWRIFYPYKAFLLYSEKEESRVNLNWLAQIGARYCDIQINNDCFTIEDCIFPIGLKEELFEINGQKVYSLGTIPNAIVEDYNLALLNLDKRPIGDWNFINSLFAEPCSIKIRGDGVWNNGTQGTLITFVGSPSIKEYCGIEENYPFYLFTLR